MSNLVHLKKEQQQLMPLFNGAFLENKPIPFPDMYGSKAYSNIFYWAHLVAFETSAFPLHPHQGFEIMTFVLKGSIEHYDTATKVWTPLGDGGVQVIQAGSGVEHSERITKGTELFQIWFDPDFSQSLKEKARYIDYQADMFKTIKENGIEKLFYIKEKGVVESITKPLEIEKMNFISGKYKLDLDNKYIYSYYLINGDMFIDNNEIKKDDFLILEDYNCIELDIKNSAELFVIKSPAKVEYQRFIDTRF